MKFSSSAAALVLASASSVAGIRHHGHLKPPPLSFDNLTSRDTNTDHAQPARKIRGTNNVWQSSSSASPPALKNSPASFAANANIGVSFFQQQVDHNDPTLGTFGQRFWYSTEFWTGPGAPVVLFTPGESAAEDYTGYLTNRTLTGQFAQAIGGAVVMFEHRYWGESSPFDNLTTKNLQYLTLANSIADATNFARNVKLPFDNSTRSNALHAPWVLSGGSYSGALTAWVEHVDPGTFWAYHASSAVVESIGNFWQYFEPVRDGLPKNCSADVELVIDHIDSVLTGGSAADVKALKDKFGLGGVSHNDDFASVLTGGPGAWQNHDFDSGYSTVYQFCDYVENAVPGVFNSSRKPDAVPGASGVGLKKALNGYAKFVKDQLLPGYCESFGPAFQGKLNLDCMDSHNASNPIYLDTSVDNAIDRQWTWLLCNEPFMYWQTGAPKGTPTLVSRLVDFDYMQAQCALYFPEDDGYTFGSSSRIGKTPDDVNEYDGGWSVTNTTRLIWANGEFDPWRDATVSSDFRPGGPLVSTPEAPVNVIPGGIHCSDLIYANALVNEGVMAVVKDEIATIKGWVDEFYKSNGKRGSQ
ncbi:serine peptidase [Sporothrix schenckii 1099-18]|uniref:Serine peptidase n=1 Tax=Sporothrix schenckii 1099-18 TaxID=1397361 RepID=A0A0F2MLA6_SPOSC|nr:serine peptidase [Sporothrix schenckii 1099-18]KJR88951.1 serine peptidase [Sporothrix schenckii 1099-18]